MHHDYGKTKTDHYGATTVETKQCQTCGVVYSRRLWQDQERTSYFIKGDRLQGCPQCIHEAAPVIPTLPWTPVPVYRPTSVRGRLLAPVDMNPGPERDQMDRGKVRMAMFVVETKK